MTALDTIAATVFLTLLAILVFCVLRIHVHARARGLNGSGRKVVKS
jgi:hypothetical protein